MKICLITLEDKLGTPLYNALLANALARAGNEVYQIIPEKVNRDYFDESVNMVFITRPYKLFSLAVFKFYNIIRAIRCMRPDVVHLRMKHPWFIPILLYLRYLHRHPIVVTIDDIRKHPGDWEPPLWTMAHQMMKKLADKVIVHGNELKKSLMGEGIPEAKIAVIPHGDLSFFTKFEREGIVEENTVLFFGRIREYKGLEYLIKAEPLITKQFPEVKIVIAGSGDFSKYEGLIKNRESFKVAVWDEYIPDDEVAGFFQRAKVVVLPYIEASQSGIIPVAYAFKKPVVVTRVGSIPEVVDDGITGFLVSPGDEKALAGAVIKLLADDELRKEMGENGYQKMRRELSWDRIAERTIEVYEEAIQNVKSKFS